MMKKLFYSIFVASAFLMSTQLIAQTNDKSTLSAAEKRTTSKDKKLARKKAITVLGVSSKNTVISTDKKTTTPANNAKKNEPTLGIMNKKEK